MIGDWRHLVHFCVLTAAASAACGVDPLLGMFRPATQPDAGEPGTDAGSVDGGHVDGGSPRDGGPDEQDDAGPPTEPDGGSGCAFSSNPDVPFTCEGDEDFCDPADDVVLGATDILGVWSRIDGAELVVDVRFRAMPFRGGSTQGTYFAMGYPYAGEAAGYVFQYPTDAAPYGRIYSVGTLYLGEDTPPLTYPPADVYEYPADLTPGNRCDLFALSATEPLLRLRFPIGSLALPDGEPARYSVVSLRPNIPSVTPYQIDDVFFGNGEELLTSLGGAPDFPGDWVGICDLRCPAEPLEP